MPLRVAIDSQIFCSQTYGGISRYFAKLSEELDTQGQFVRIFAPLHRNEYLGGLRHGLVAGRRLPYVPSRMKRVLIPLNSILCSRSIRAWKPDIIHETYYKPRGFGLDNTPSIITVYDMVHEVFGDSFSVFDDTSQVKRKAVERANHIICISENTRTDLVDLWNIPVQKTSVIHLGHDSLVCGADHHVPLLNGKPYILYVANRKGYKNFSCLVSAYAKSPRLMRDFQILAFGGGSLSSEESSLIKSLGIRRENVVTLTGDDSAFARAYAGAGVFVYPSLYEGFGLSPLEAMGLGCPVISSNSSCLPEVLGDAADYFHPESPEELMYAMELMLYDKQRREMYRDRGYRQVTLYPWETCAKATLSVYELVAGAGL